LAQAVDEMALEHCPVVVHPGACPVPLIHGVLALVPKLTARAELAPAPVPAAMAELALVAHAVALVEHAPAVPLAGFEFALVLQPPVGIELLSRACALGAA